MVTENYYPALNRFFVFILLIGNTLFAQTEKVYDENGMLRSVTPINKKGVFNGTSLHFYPDGAKEKEIPYKNGLVHGTQKEFFKKGQIRSISTFEKGKQVGLYQVFFPNGQHKMKQDWEEGKRTGEMKVFYEDGQMRIYALLHNDSILFAQNFDRDGRINSERIGYINQKLDPDNIGEARIFLEEGSALRSNLTSRAQIIVPQVPSSFIEFESQDVAIEKNEDEIYPLLLTPQSDKSVAEIYVLVKLAPFSQATIRRRVSVKIK
ncbi:MAG: toxin-antitoxin system YwqK family antitoxin [Bacteroidia bacterium]|nr:toxin-antitoxin system YwqK family antitoxin [Bacteroidia bacterium]